MNKKIYIENRIKYFRGLLNITQKELARDDISLQQIKFLESNKRGITLSVAKKLSDNLNKIAIEKNINLCITENEILKEPKEMARDLCEKDLNDLNSINDSSYIYAFKCRI